MYESDILFPTQSARLVIRMNIGDPRGDRVERNMPALRGNV